MSLTTLDIPGTPYLYEAAQADVLTDTDERVRTLRAEGRLSPEVLERIRRYFRVKNIYHSNAIEGNRLDVGETRQVVELGLTLTGKPLKDQAEATNLSHALDFLEEIAGRSDAPITEHDLRQMHALVLRGINDENAGRYRTVPVEIAGSAYKPPPPESVSPQMEELGRWLAVASMLPQTPGTSGLLLATAAHAWFVTIHPFIDGNGRVGRLLMNLMLMRYGYPIAVITKEDRARYYDALEESQTSSLALKQRQVSPFEVKPGPLDRSGIAALEGSLGPLQVMLGLLQPGRCGLQAQGRGYPVKGRHPGSIGDGLHQPLGPLGQIERRLPLPPLRIDPAGPEARLGPGLGLLFLGQVKGRGGGPLREHQAPPLQVQLDQSGVQVGRCGRPRRPGGTTARLPRPPPAPPAWPPGWTWRW